MLSPEDRERKTRLGAIRRATQPVPHAGGVEHHGLKPSHGQLLDEPFRRGRLAGAFDAQDRERLGHRVEGQRQVAGDAELVGCGAGHGYSLPTCSLTTEPLTARI